MRLIERYDWYVGVSWVWGNICVGVQVIKDDTQNDRFIVINPFPFVTFVYCRYIGKFKVKM